MYYYIDRKTGKRVSADKWKHSKAQGGSRYVRRAGKANSRGGKTSSGKKTVSASAKSSRNKSAAPAAPKTMFRVTVGTKYIFKDRQGRTKTGTSKATTWVKTEKQAEAALAKLEKAVERQSEKVINNRGRFTSKANKSIQRVAYDNEFIDEFDFADEEDDYKDSTR